MSPRRDLAEAVRELAAVTAVTDVADPVMTEAVASVRALTALLRERQLADVPRTPYDEAVGARDYGWHLDNPALPGLSMVFEDGRATASIPAGLGAAYAGPPGKLHGGVGALLLDVLLSSLVQHHGVPAVTASLRLDYRAPTPLDAPLRITGEVVARSGRKVETVGALWHGEVATVEARGLFVQL
ncbi:PaaI family thioesterase [Nocardioides nitrophenolicus]|uniref:PaaI family thioesterase n=1 Tax=Nocardioides nitrophenolicus TaxID=60489 RepID=UPI00195EFA25|nr:hotdog domain-containing protein [Nocardioides nitrophenolicus]MBM7517154.1 acyl-coenzyme A thioesterase PaaI-like protein [Nocardioides nitrophenolicus]